MDISCMKDREKEYWNRKYKGSSNDGKALTMDIGGFIRNNLTPVYEEGGVERGDLEKFAYDLIEIENVKDKEVLDYACGGGEWGIFMALNGAKISGFDISEEAIRVACQRAVVNNVTRLAKYEVMDAENLKYSSETFDLVIGIGALHHVIKYPNASHELFRVLKKGGRAVFTENLGHNIFVQLARYFTMRKSRRFGETVLKYALIQDFGREFAQVNIYEMNLLFMLKRMFRGRYNNVVIRRVLRLLKMVDDSALSCFPSLRRFCGEAVIEYIK